MSAQDRYEAYRRRELLRLRRSLNRIQDETLLLRRDIAARRMRKFNPDQPRVPAGNADGGQWTSGGGGGGAGLGLGLGESLGFGEDMGGGLFVDPTGEASWSSYSEGWSGDGSVFERDIVNRDGSTIQSEYAASRAAGFDQRQTVRLESGERVSFETTDRVQTIRHDDEIVSRSLWTPSGPEPDATVQPAFAPMVAAPAIIIGGAILFNWQSQQNGIGGQQAVMGFNAREYRPSAPGAFDLSLSGQVSQKEAEAACKYLPRMQAWLDEEVAKAGPIDNYPSPRAYGTHIHKRLEQRINERRLPDLYAEESFLKEVEEGRLSGADYGEPGTVRIDAIEYRRDGTICVYDFKTGDAGVGPSRSYVLGRAAYFSRLTQSRAIVMEVRPSKR